MSNYRLSAHTLTQYLRQIRVVTNSERPPRYYRQQVEIKSPTVTQTTVTQTTVIPNKTGPNYMKICRDGKIVTLTMDHKNPSKNFLAELKLLETDGNEDFECFSLHCSSQNEEDEIGDLIYSNDFIDKVYDTFIVRLKVSRNFKPSNFSLNDKIFVVRFHCLNAHWFTGAHFLTLNCLFIYLKDCTLKNEDINRYLELWKSGEYPVFVGFYFVMLDGCELDLEAISKGLGDLNGIHIDDEGNESFIFHRELDGKQIQLDLEPTKKNLKCKILS